MNRTSSFLILALSAMLSHHVAFGQTLPPIILEIDTEKAVGYQSDLTVLLDPTKFGTNPNPTPQLLPSGSGLTLLPFGAVVFLADIVAVNGRPAKGLVFAYDSGGGGFSPTPRPGEPIADTTNNGMRYQTFQILQIDGTPVGTLMTLGLRAPGNPPPGAPLAQTTDNSAIVGGTGAFLGARGQQGQERTPQTVNGRQASMAEDPANRRINGGGRIRYILQVIPMSRPEIVVTANGPAITHSSDFSLVSAAKPAAPGEVLSLSATSLGPTRPGVDAGQAFPTSPLAQVNSPVEVTVNGAFAEVLGAVGYPGAVDAYQVNFRVPPEAAKGTATIQVSAAWIPSAPVNITIQ